MTRTFACGWISSSSAPRLSASATTASRSSTCTSEVHHRPLLARREGMRAAANVDQVGVKPLVHGDQFGLHRGLQPRPNFVSTLRNVQDKATIAHW